MSRKKKAAVSSNGKQQPSSKAKREQSRQLRALNETAAWLLRDSKRMLGRHRKRIPKDVAEKIERLRAHLESVCEPAPKERDLDDVAAATNALDSALMLHLARYRKSPLREYIEAIFWAVTLALLIRAFVFEAFKIPTGSMIPTLEVHDHLFVNKFIYGLKIPFTRIKFLTFRQPQRGEIIVFEYPYDDDPDSVGKDLIKRVVAVAGDRVRLQDNRIVLGGTPISRTVLSPLTDCEESTENIRSCPDSPSQWCVYGVDFERGGTADQLVGRFADIEAAQGHIQDMDGFACKRSQECVDGGVWQSQHRVKLGNADGLIWSGPINDPNWPPQRFDGHRLGPHARQYTAPDNTDWPDFTVPEGTVFVMGDNRDNSKDGRYFGLVPLDAVKGKAGFIWYAYKRSFFKPNLGRIGTIIHQDTDDGTCP